MDFYKILMGGVGVGMSNFDRLFMEKYGGGGSIQEITGTLPLAVRSRASQVLENYRVYGASGGVGDKTANLCGGGESFWHDGYYINAQGVPQSSYGSTWGETYSDYISVIPGQVLTFSRFNGFPSPAWRGIAFYDVNDVFISRTAQEQSYALKVVVPNDATYCRVTFRTQGKPKLVMLTEGSTAPETYIPYGYKLPIKITAGGTTTDYPIYIGDSQLMEGEYVDYEKQKIYKLIDGVLTPTDPPVPFPDITIPEGEVTIDIEGELKPEATVKGLISPTS